MALPFNKLTTAMPGQQTVRDDMGAIRTIQAASQVPKSQTGPQISQSQVSQMAGALEAPKQAERLETVKENTDLRTKETQRNLQQQGLQSQEMLSNKQLAISQEDRKIRERINAMSSKEYGKLFNETMQFKRDELGRTQWNENQLIDWAASKAKTDEELANYSQIVTQGYERKAEIKSHAFSMIMEDMKAKGNEKIQQMTQVFERTKSELDKQLAIAIKTQNNEAELQIRDKQNKLTARLNEMKQGLNLALQNIAKENMKQQARDTARANNTMMILQAAGTVAGIVAITAATGGAATLPAIAAAGSMGGGLASLGGTAYNSNKEQTKLGRY